MNAREFAAVLGVLFLAGLIILSVSNYADRQQDLHEQCIKAHGEWTKTGCELR